MANIGLLTGKDSGLWILDIDIKNNGFESLKALENEWGNLPISIRVKTGGGGLHIYFKSGNQTLKNRVNILAGLDFRGDGGYIVAPPSIHASGRRYEWLNSFQDFNGLEELPEFLIAILEDRGPSSPQTKDTKPIQSGSRNNSLASFAGFFRSQGLDSEQMTKLLHIANQELCEPQLTNDEVDKIAKSISKYKKPEPWPELKELPKTEIKAQNMTVELLPEALREWILDICERMQVPLEFVAAPAVVCLASLIGRKIGIRPLGKDPWTVIPNLWGYIVADPGSMKSPAIAEATKPLEILAKKARKEFEQKCREKQLNERATEIQIESLKESLRIQNKNSVMSRVEDKKTLLAAIQGSQNIDEEKITEKRYKTNDPTIEKLAVLLQENPQGILLLRDELSGWLESLNKVGREGSREFYLESWNGNTPYSVDRIGRGTVHVDALCLSIFGGIQPAKLDDYIDKTTSAKGDDGFLERFQISVYPNRPKTWELINREPNYEAEQAVQSIFEYLDAFDGHRLCRDPSASVPYITFDSEAQAIANEWRTWLEKRLLDEEQPPLFKSCLSKYRSLMPSLALIFTMLEISSSSGRHKRSVGVDETVLAIKWCEYLESHCKKIFQNLLNGGLASAELLKNKIVSRQLIDGDTLREIGRKNWNGLNSSEKLMGAISVLTDLGWVRVETVHSKGGRSEVLRINPKVPFNKN